MQISSSSIFLYIYNFRISMQIDIILKITKDKKYATTNIPPIPTMAVTLFSIDLPLKFYISLAINHCIFVRFSQSPEEGTMTNLQKDVFEMRVKELIKLERKVFFLKALDWVFGLGTLILIFSAVVLFLISMGGL